MAFNLYEMGNKRSKLIDSSSNLIELCKKYNIPTHDIHFKMRICEEISYNQYLICKE